MKKVWYIKERRKSERALVIVQPVFCFLRYGPDTAAQVLTRHSSLQLLYLIYPRCKFHVLPHRREIISLALPDQQMFLEVFERPMVNMREPSEDTKMMVRLYYGTGLRRTSHTIRQGNLTTSVSENAFQC
jgi:hypothetical protein